MNKNETEKEIIDYERNQILNQLENWLETPMVILGFIWLALLIVDLINGLSPFLKVLNNCIWVVFIIDFFIKFFISPKKFIYIKNNLLVVISLFLPALRILAIFRSLRIISMLAGSGGLRIIQIITAINRGMKSLTASMNRRGFGYVLALTVIVLFAGAAGMYAFENKVPAVNGLKNYGTSLWWTAMLMTTIGSEYWPKTPEGRILCLIISLYSIAVLGYITAALATFFVERDACDEEADIPGAKSIEEIRKEILSLKELLKENTGNN
jgi:voltage-gated potassium channel